MATIEALGTIQPVDNLWKTLGMICGELATVENQPSFQVFFQQHPVGNFLSPYFFPTARELPVEKVLKH